MDERRFLLNCSRDIINKFGSSIFAHLRVIVVVFVIVIIIILRLPVFPELAGDMIDMNTNRRVSNTLGYNRLQIDIYRGKN